MLLSKDGKLYTIKSGKILSSAPKDIDGSFLTLESEDGEEVLYLWKYWAENEYQIVMEVANEN